MGEEGELKRRRTALKQIVAYQVLGIYMQCPYRNAFPMPSTPHCPSRSGPRWSTDPMGDWAPWVRECR